MRTRYLLCVLSVLPLLACGACGPRDVGEGTSTPPSEMPGVSVEDQLRFPVTGTNAVQQRLYWQTRPDMMEQTQQWQHQKWQRATGAALEKNPESPQYRAVPQQRSPFRQ